MTEVISLNRARKARDKSLAKAEAAENRAKFGRTKSEKEADRVMAAKVVRELDAHKRDRP